LDRENIPVDSVEQRIRIQRAAARTYEPEHFAPLATAVLQRRRVTIEHLNRDRNEVVKREISPQRLTHYRENWYVDAYCHLRHQLRSFGLDAIQGVVLNDEPAQESPDSQLQAELDGGYGIFSGETIEWAELVFTPERARWVSKETWHPEQTGWFDADGAYHLKVPFSSTTELTMDILRHIPDVRVVGPEHLREQVRRQLQKALDDF
jgi:predicted DNA-binding transcriptional regulator YafY